MPIPDEDVTRVRAATDLAALVAEHSTLKRVGRRMVGLCPFHQEKSPSFSVNPEEGLYYCFGCQVSGDAISFVRATEGLDFVEAVERLAARAGIAIRYDAEGGAAARADQERRQALLRAMEAAVEAYHDRLLHHAGAGAARRYLRSRGYDGEVVRSFKLGWSPDGWDELVRSIGQPKRLLVETGLAFVNKTGRLQDSFRSRVIFPIFDTAGRPIALGGRILPGGDVPGPKYKNSPETPIYSKRRTLYGLNWAKTELMHSSEVVVCEGYTDVIGFFSAGVRRAVATCGTALTEEHLKVLGSFAKRVVLAFDADSAGQSAAARIYEGERRHGLEVAVASFPAGMDPGDLARDDPEALAKSVREAIPFLAFRVNRALAAEDLSIPEGRARAAEAAVAAVAEHPNELVRDQYLVQIADRTRIEPDRLRNLLVNGPASGAAGDAERRVGPEGPRHREPRHDDEPPDYYDDEVSDDDGPGWREERRPSAPRRSGGGRPERDALALAIRRPAEMAPYLHEALFADRLILAAFRALSSVPSLHAAIDAARPEVADLLRRLAVSEVIDDVDGVLVALVRVAAERELSELEREARLAADEHESGRVAALSEDAGFVLEVLARLSADGSGAEDAEPLLAWLAGRHREAV